MRKKNLVQHLLVLPALLAGVDAIAQQTGSFNQDITFMGSQRRLSCYVSPSYDATVPARLIIGLHGLGDNSTNYRNALVNSLGFAAASPNTILICPDGGSDPQKDFYTPVGDEAVIEESIAYARANYNIDTTEIVLQGFSLGGRSALRYGLQHTEIFKGLLLHTPAVQGVKEALTQFTSGGLYDYAQASQIPVYITHGNTDILYEAPIDSTREQLVRNNAPNILYRFSGGHTVPPYAQIQNFWDFFEEPEAAGPDLAVNRVIMAPRSCNAAVPATVLVQNTGNATLSNIVLRYEWNGTALYHSWTGSLEPSQHAEISLPVFTATAGDHELKVTADTLNGGLPDAFTGNNEAETSFRIVTDAAELPLTEQFNDDSYNDRWLTQRSGDYFLPWSYDDEIGALTSLNTIFIFENINQKEEFLSPVLDLTSMAAPKVGFDVAYNYTSFTAAFIGIDTVFADTLEVLVSTDCGNSYQSVYKKGGEALRTFPGPIVNPASVDAYFLAPEDDNWRRELIDLSAFATSQEAIVKFRYISALGGIIYLDNIAFGDGTVSVTTPGTTEAAISLYPNPVQDLVTLTSKTGGLKSVTLYDFTGRTLLQRDGKAQRSMQLSLGQLPEGIYLLDIRTEKGAAKRKITVKH